MRRCRRAECPPLSSSLGALPSDQWLVTVDLTRMTIVAEAPLDRDFMGPLSVSLAHGLATFGASEFDGLVQVDFKSGRLTPLALAPFGSVYQFAGAHSRDTAYVVTVYPQPSRLFAIRLPLDGSAPVVTTNATFNLSGFAYAAIW